MAYQGRKVWSAGDVLTASDMNSTVDQSVMNFADAAARNTAFPSGVEGAVVYLRDQNQFQFYNGNAWVGMGFAILGTPVYANEAARDAAITSPANGMVVYITDVAELQYYDGAWNQVGSGAGGGGYSDTFLLMGA
jgi:hypothetical protein